MSYAEGQGEMDDPVISIGVLAQKVGLSVSTVRKYENEGLVIAHRAESGHRLFSHEDVSRVRNIQHMIQDLGLNIEGIRRMQSLLPCWDLLPCTADTQNQCAAYRDSARPCWMNRDCSCPTKGNDCRRCPVYRFGSLCAQDIKRLLHDRSALENADAGVRELLGRLGNTRPEG